IEPLVESGDEVHPLENLQALFGAGAIGPLRDNKGCAKPGCQCPGSRGLNKISSSDLLASHDSLLFVEGCFPGFNEPRKSGKLFFETLDREHKSLKISASRTSQCNPSGQTGVPRINIVSQIYT